MPDDGRADEGILPGGYAEADPSDPGYEDPGYEDPAYGVAADGDAPYDDAGYDDEGYEEADYGDPGYDDPGYDGSAVAAPAGARRRQGRSPRVRRRRRVATVILAILVLIVVVAGAALAEALHQINPGGKPGRAVTVVIPDGSSTSRIASLLAAAGVIHDATLFRFYVHIEGSGPLLAGTYSLPTNESYSRVIGVLQKGAVIPVDKLVIPEGFTLHDIAARVAALPGMHLSAARFLRASSSGAVRSPFEPAGVNNLEGLVFPATYDISRTDTAVDIMQELVTTFDERADALHLRDAAKLLDMTPYQVVTVASIVEGEAKFAAQYPDTASVIYNRLKAGMTLGADSTLIYALRLTDPGVNIAAINYEQPSPYNTRLNTGLPPTPIDSPSLPALRAAIQPPTTSLLYFVEIATDGQLGFASTSAGFAQLEAQCQAAHLGC